MSHADLGFPSHNIDYIYSLQIKDTRILHNKIGIEKVVGQKSSMVKEGVRGKIPEF